MRTMNRKMDGTMAHALVRTAKNAVRTVVTAGAALVLCTGLTTSAHAATGAFTYVNVNEDDFVLQDPVSGECYLLVSGATRAENATNARASIFAERDCEGPSMRVMGPRASAHFGPALPHSVRFG